MSRLVFLGTGSALPTAERGNTALAVSGPEDGAWLQIDCGPDAYRALTRARIGPDGVRDLLITHAHIDHIGGLPTLVESFRLSGRKAPLRIWAIPEVLAAARSILDVFGYELTLDTWPFEVVLQTIEPATSLILAGISLRAARMDHTLPSIGVRMDLPLGPVCYSCDTQPTPALPELAQHVSLLITECTFLQRDVDFARRSRHMTAREAGQQAADGHVGALALVHLGVGDGWNIADARAEAAETFGGRILIPSDGDAIDV